MQEITPNADRRCTPFSAETVLREGETCWRATRADRAALLIDGAGYFGALRSSLLAARRKIVIAGWDIDSRTPIRGEHPPEDDAPETLGPLLSWLVERRRRLEVCVLLWDYSVLYALEREPLPRLSLDWTTPRRVRVCLDSHLPFGASHHEKLAVIDDRLAYCGGLDLTIRRWDRPAHSPDDPDRKEPGGESYGAFHDLQMVVDGDAARSLAEIVLGRWNRAAGRRDRLIDVDTDPWPAHVEPDFRDVGVGISRTRPAYREESELRQVEAAYLRGIEQARCLIYIENQYLTADRIATALKNRLESESGLEVIIVNPKEPAGWLEERTMGQGRTRFLGRLQEPGIRERVRVLYPWVAAGDRKVPVKVHAKLMIVDDRLIQVGSANLNSRSMGVDRECDLLIEACDDTQRHTIEGIRRELMTHHLGVPPDDLQAAERERRSVIDGLEALSTNGRGLSRVSLRAATPEATSELLVQLADPERPIDPDRFLGDLFGAVQRRPLRRHLFRLLGAAALIAFALILWRFTLFVEWADPGRLASVISSVASSAWTGPIVLACFVVGSFLIFPVTVLIAATAVALGPIEGFTWALAGTLVSALANFATGCYLSEETLERWFGAWVGPVNRRLRRGGIVSVMVIRNVPIAPFSVVNVLAGASRIRARDFLTGTLLGMAPAIAALTILGDRLRGVFQQPGWLNVGLLVLAVAGWIGLALGLQMLSNRLADRR